MSTCSICCELFNKSSHSLVSCQYCAFDACRRCVETYLVQDTMREPLCMNPSCGKSWSHEFLSKVMTKTFMTTTYKKHRKQQLFLSKASYFPATQLEIESEKRFNSLKKQISEKRLELELLRQDLANMMRTTDDKVVESKRTIVRACPADNCKGFLTADWICGICDTKACSKCHEICCVDHKCNPEVLETVKLLSKDTRNCPECSAAIFKVSGCNQMFCTKCHTTFDWVTGKKEHRTFHNPHYFEWLRQNSANGEIPRQPDDNREDHDLCVDGELPRTGALQRVLSEIPGWELVDFWAIYQLVAHIKDVEVRKYRSTPAVLDVQHNMPLRKKYMLNEISEASFRMRLQQDEKKRLKNNEINQILTMFTRIIIERMNWLSSRRTKVKMSDIEPSIKEARSLRAYVCNALEVVGKRFNCVTPSINNNWMIDTV